MNVLLIESILDRYVAQAERRHKNWQPKEIEALLLELRGRNLAVPQVIVPARSWLITALAGLAKTLLDFGHGILR